MDQRQIGSTSNLIRFLVKDTTTGALKTGLTGSTSGLIISTIADNEALPTLYSQAASHIQTIAVLGTFAAPSASSCRFGEVDATNHPGLYEFQIANARFAVASSKRLIVSVAGASSTANYEIELTGYDPFATAVLLTTDANGRVDVSKVNGTALNSLVGGRMDSVASVVSDKTAYLLTSAYDLAKTASQAGDAMTLTSGERTSIATVVMGNIPLKKNTAGQSLFFFMRDQSNVFAGKSGTPAVTWNKFDGNGFVALTGGTITPVAPTGSVEFYPSQTNTNADHIVYSASLTGAVTVYIEVFPHT